MTPGRRVSLSQIRIGNYKGLNSASGCGNSALVLQENTITVTLGMSLISDIS